MNRIIIALFVSMASILSCLAAGESTQASYLIVTTTGLSAPAQKLANWKTQYGNKTIVLSRAKWSNPTAVKTSIDSTLKKNSGIKYILFFGGVKLVPTNTHDGVNTDMLYVCSATSLTTDKALGRIPVDDATTANTVVDKIIKYEKTPPTNKSFYKNIISCTGNNNISLKTSEEVGTALVKKYKYTRTRLYATDTVHNYKGETRCSEVPSDLISDNTAWKKNGNDIVKAINSGKFFTIYCGHGGDTVWSGLEFKPQHINKLTNGDKLPIVFSMCCNSGNFNAGKCLAGELLNKKNGGAIGVMACTGASYGSSDIAFVGALVNSAWTDLNFENKCESNYSYNGNVQYGMGEILTNAKNIAAKNNCYYKNILGYHYFGDPAMEMFSQEPICLGKPRISLEGDNLRVNTNDVKGCTVTVTSLVDNGKSYFRTYKMGSSESEHIFVGIKFPYVVTIRKHNYAPYVGADLLMFQNKTLTGEVDAFANTIMAGYDIYSNNSNGKGNVVVKSGKTSFRAEKIQLKKGFKVAKGAKFSAKKQAYSCSYGGTNTLRMMSIEDDDEFLTDEVISDVESRRGGIYLYPNPTDGEFFISFATEDVDFHITITDATGKTVYTTSGTGRGQAINLEGKSSGVYFVHVNAGENTYIEKIILK